MRKEKRSNKNVGARLKGIPMRHDTTVPKKNNIHGITLIALVITIIALLILAGVVINLVIGEHGIIKMAEKAGKNYTEASNKEKQDLEDLDKDLEKLTIPATIWKQDGTTVTDGKVTLKVGDYVAYEPQTEKTEYLVKVEDGADPDNIEPIKYNKLNWRVLGVTESGQLELISDNTTNDQIYLKGYQAYNNGVYLMNDACNTLYKNSKNGSTARALSMEDIEKRLNLDVWDYREYTTSNGIKYGETVELTEEGKKYYPEILKQEKKQYVDGEEGKRYGQSEQNEKINQTSPLQANNSIKITQNFWYDSDRFLDDGLSSENYIDPIYCELFNIYSTFLASRCINVSNKIYFGLYYWDGGTNGGMGQYGMYDSSGEQSGDFYSLTPIITLGSHVQIDTSDSSKNGTSAENAWKLK